QERREGDDPVELGVVPPGPPAAVIAILLATSSVPTGCLEVAVGIDGDPDIRPGRGDGQGADPGQRGPIADDPAAGVAIRKAATRAPPGDPRMVVRRVAQAGPACRDVGIGAGDPPACVRRAQVVAPGHMAKPTDQVTQRASTCPAGPLSATCRGPGPREASPVEGDLQRE